MSGGAASAVRPRWTGRQFHNQPEASHTHGFLTALWDEVAAATGGALLVSVHARNGGVAGSDPAALAMLVAGELEFMTLMGGLIGQVVPVAEIQGLPFAFDNHAQVHRTMQGALGDYLREEMAAKGIHGFRHGVLENGFRHIVSIDRPVRSVADLAGYRMRIPAGRMFDDLFRALGAEPVVVNISELYGALREHTVDGQENPLVITEVNRLYEVCRYVSLTGHMWSGFNLIANRAFWRRLPEAVQETVNRAVAKHVERQRAYTDRCNLELKTRLETERGLVFNAADTASFRRALSADFYRRWQREFGTKAWSLLGEAVGPLGRAAVDCPVIGMQPAPATVGTRATPAPPCRTGGRSAMRLLLVNPRFPESFWTFKWAIDEVLPGVRATNPPLGLATLAALCPADWEVEIVDENVETLPLAPAADLIGVCGMGVQYERQTELLRFYRSRGYRVVAGGSYASLCPEKYADVADTVVAGEAEHVWPRFCADLAAGAPQALYRETGSIALADSPTPRFDLLKLDRYSMASLQFSRGCPFRCEFCDIIVMFGRRPRVKPLEQVGRELDALREQGVRRVFFVDDNLIGNRPQAKALLAFLAEYQARHTYRFSFGTEASLNLARDEELLRLFRAANFAWVFIGIETTDEASLKETKKTQNVGGDILADVQRMYAYGIDVLAGFIVGFDNDTLDTFDRQREFVMASGIQSAMIGLLHALPRTPLHERMQREGRLRTLADGCDNTVAGTNIVPKRMDYDEMVARYKALYRELLTDRAIGERVRNKMRHMREPLYTGGFGTADSLRIIWRLVRRGVLPGGPSRWAAFLGSLPLLRPRQIPCVISDWIIALSMADFARRRLEAPVADGAAEGRVAVARAAIGRYLDAGAARLQVAFTPALDVSLSLQGVLDRRFFVRAARHLEELLRHTPSVVTLRIEALRDGERRHLDRLLRRLRRYGDRVSIVLDERLRAAVPIDSSVFRLVLGADPQRVAVTVPLPSRILPASQSAVEAGVAP